MPAPLKKPAPGDPLEIRASDFGRIIDATLDYEKRRLPGSDATNTVDPSIVAVLNNTGGDLDRFAVVGFDDTVIDPGTDEDGFTNKVRLSGREPIAGDKGRFGVYLMPVTDGDVGMAVVDGVCTVQIEVGDAGDKFADVTPGDTDKLTSGATGAQILWKESGTGTKWGVVRIGDGGSTLGLFNGTNVAVAAPPFLSIPALRGMTNVAVFAVDTAPGTSGASLSLKAGTSNRVTIVWNSTAGTWGFDYVRFHS